MNRFLRMDNQITKSDISKAFFSFTRYYISIIGTVLFGTTNRCSLETNRMKLMGTTCFSTLSLSMPSWLCEVSGWSPSKKVQLFSQSIARKLGTVNNKHLKPSASKGWCSPKNLTLKPGHSRSFSRVKTVARPSQLACFLCCLIISHLSLIITMNNSYSLGNLEVGNPQLVDDLPFSPLPGQWRIITHA